MIDDWKIPSLISFLEFEAYNSILLNKVAKAFDDLPLDLQGRVALYVQ